MIGALDLPQLIAGETVTVLTPKVSYDADMERVTTWERATVENVVVAPGTTSDVTSSERPYGTLAAFNLGFPKTFSASLRGCRVIVRCPEGESEAEHTYAVIGDPHPNNKDSCPTQWWYTAQVEAVDG